nr:hypothetical protein [Tanacetum cinerariifolium]
WLWTVRGVVERVVREDGDGWGRDGGSDGVRRGGGVERDVVVV